MYIYMSQISEIESTELSVFDCEGVIGIEAYC